MRNLVLLFLSFLLPNFLFAQIEANSWAYQLQNISISQISNNTTFDLVVIDYSQDGTDAQKFSSKEIMQIKNSGKKAIAYISIGEAETYRPYWMNEWDADNNGIPDSAAPSWLGNENPNWKGNYEVRFWEEEWQKIIYTYIDTIIAQNFDGIYCDIVDGYYYWREVAKEKDDADTLMIQFLSNIRAYVDSKTSNQFLIIPQNGEFIIEEDNVTPTLRQKYFNSIDAIGIEDVFFYGNLDEDNPYNPDNTRLNVLTQFIQNKKPVFSVEYLTDANLIETYISKAKEYGFIPYVSKRSLDILNDGIILSAEDNFETLPNEFILLQNYPNPFNPSTTIEYSIPVKSRSGVLPGDLFIKLKIYDLLGSEIATLVNKEQKPGNYKVTFNPIGLASGIYFYSLQVGNFNINKSMLLIK